jgi:hypothetical protein
MADACREAARTRDDLADIINVALEDLVRNHYELPAFATMLCAARSARADINQGYHTQIRERLSAVAAAALNTLLERPPRPSKGELDSTEIATRFGACTSHGT